jgi:hypothetical protein
MKYLSILALCAAVLTGCDSPTNENTGITSRYNLTHYVGRALPAQVTPPGAACVDSIYSGSIELNAAPNATWTLSEVRNCGGVRTPKTTIRTGTYSAVSDSMFFRWRVENDPLLDEVPQSARVEGRELIFSDIVYSEQNPNGGERYIWAVYRRE